jgi:hypothetical protein
MGRASRAMPAARQTALSGTGESWAADATGNPQARHASNDDVKVLRPIKPLPTEAPV